MIKDLELNKIRGIVNYQFRQNVGHTLFCDDVKIIHSKKTGRIRYVFSDGKLIAILRPKNGLFSLTIFGAHKLLSILEKPRARVVIQDEIKEFILKGRNVFAKHVVATDKEIRVGEEAIVTDKEDKLMAIGKALMSGKEMLAFNRGVAVKVRKGVMEEDEDCGE